MKLTRNKALECYYSIGGLARAGRQSLTLSLHQNLAYITQVCHGVTISHETRTLILSTACQAQNAACNIGSEVLFVNSLLTIFPV